MLVPGDKALRQPLRQADDDGRGDIGQRDPQGGGGAARGCGPDRWPRLASGAGAPASGGHRWSLTMRCRSFPVQPFSIGGHLRQHAAGGGQILGRDAVGQRRLDLGAIPQKRFDPGGGGQKDRVLAAVILGQGRRSARPSASSASSWRFRVGVSIPDAAPVRSGWRPDYGRSPPAAGRGHRSGPLRLRVSEAGADVPGQLQDRFENNVSAAWLSGMVVSA